MGKFYGDIGYATMIEISPGSWQEQIVERSYSIDIIRNVSRTQKGENLNDDLTVDNRFSVIADPFAYDNFSTMRYIKWLGALWKIISVDVQRPRLILTIGGVYNEQAIEIP